MRSKPTTIDDYLAGVLPEQRATLQRLRETIRAIIPDAEECIRYNMPAFRLDGKIVAGFAATSTACSFYPFSGSTLTTLARDVARYSRTKGALHFASDKPLPATLVRKLIRARVAEQKDTPPRGRPKRGVDCVMAYEVDFTNVSTVGLESSPVASALAGLRANEARYFKNKYGEAFVVEPAKNAKKLIDYVHRILKQERDIVIESRPLEATELHVDNIRWTFVFYESGLAINVLYTLDDEKKRAVGFKLSDGMEVPPELASRFKFARQKSKLAGTIRGSFFVIKGEY
jgi:uncharacterized protein YdhG (YjbR/CyaY superfamily)